jgi:hypothetical protein
MNTAGRNVRPEASPSKPTLTLPDWALFVREPFAERIISGRKTWEIRTRPTHRRGRIAIMSQRGLLGTVEIYDVAGPLTAADLVRHIGKHRAPLRLLHAYAAGRALYAWVLREPARLDPPLVLRHGRGPVVWFRLTPSPCAGRSSGRSTGTS